MIQKNNDMRKNYFVVGFAFGVLLTATLMWFITIPNVIEKRGRNLNVYRYNGQLNKFVPRDSILLTKDEFQYLVKGNFKYEWLTK